MKKSEVPQEEGPIFLGNLGKCATNEQGDFELVPSMGWNPVNVAAEVIFGYMDQQVADARAKVEQGLASPLAYHLEVKQMDDKLAAYYTGFFRWQIRRHKRPEVFRKLSRSVLERYAKVLNLSVEELSRLPETDANPWHVPPADAKSSSR